MWSRQTCHLTPFHYIIVLIPQFHICHIWNVKILIISNFSTCAAWQTCYSTPVCINLFPLLAHMHVDTNSKHKLDLTYIGSDLFMNKYCPGFRGMFCLKIKFALPSNIWHFQVGRCCSIPTALARCECPCSSENFLSCMEIKHFASISNHHYSFTNHHSS